jgi:hypothetical protein
VILMKSNLLFSFDFCFMCILSKVAKIFIMFSKIFIVTGFIFRPDPLWVSFSICTRVRIEEFFFFLHLHVQWFLTSFVEKTTLFPLSCLKHTECLRSLPFMIIPSYICIDSFLGIHSVSLIHMSFFFFPFFFTITIVQ